jgi:hypothetical protein
VSGAPTNRDHISGWLQQPGVAETLVCAISAITYVASLAFGFVYDDVPQILNNPAIHTWKQLPQYFSSHVWSAIYPNTAGNYYRPVFLLWLRLNYAIFGATAFAWHLTSVACHVFVTYLVFRLGLKVAGERTTAFLAALIFALHPAHVESVAWISGVTDPLMSCFFLASFVLFLDYRQSRRIWSLVGSLALFALALLTKETAVVLPALVFIYVLIFERTENDVRTTAGEMVRGVRESSPYISVVLGYATVRAFALHGWSHATVPISWTQVLLTWPSVISFYARHMILPLRLSEFYGLDYVSRATAGSFLLPLALCALVAYAFYFLARFISVRNASSSMAATFSLPMMILPLLPVLDLRSLTAGDIVHDRYLYLPSVGFALLLALAIRELSSVRDRQLGFRQIAVAGVIASVFGGVTVVEQMYWADDLALYTRGIESAPNNLTVRDNLANVLLKANHPELAIPLYLEVLHRNPNFWHSNYNLGFAYYKIANYAAAEQYLERANRIDPSDADQYIYLALAQFRLNKLAEAEKNAQEAIAINPHARGYHAVLAMIYQADQDRTHALSELETEIAEHPENSAAATELQTLDRAPARTSP